MFQHVCCEAIGPPGDVAVQLLADPVACVERLARIYGGAVGLQLGGQRCVLVTDPTLVAQVIEIPL
eukprot:scaffold423503_cov46-Prasinocladus_malaysianus.AAC.1